MFNKTAITALAAVTLLAAAGPLSAHAADTDSNSVKVSYGDLDLGSPEGAKTMVARIHRAASMVCNDGQEERWDMARRDRVRACVKHASAEAVTALASPMVTAMSHGDSHAMMAALAER